MTSTVEATRDHFTGSAEFDEEIRKLKPGHLIELQDDGLWLIAERSVDGRSILLEVEVLA